MATATSEEKVTYLLTVMKHTIMAKPDYAAIAVEMGINTSGNAQRRFRSVIKSAGFDLVNDQIVGPDGASGDGTVKTTPAKKGRAKKANGATVKKTTAKKEAADADVPDKKRKLDQTTAESAGDEDVKKIKTECKHEPNEETDATLGEIETADQE